MKRRPRQQASAAPRDERVAYVIERRTVLVDGRAQVVEAKVYRTPELPVTPHARPFSGGFAAYLTGGRRGRGI